MSDNICNKIQSHCRCILLLEHDGAHECDKDCEGLWNYDKDGNLLIIKLPNISETDLWNILGLNF